MNTGILAKLTLQLSASARRKKALDRIVHLFDRLFDHDFTRMLFTGSSDDVLDFKKGSMFYWNDPLFVINRGVPTKKYHGNHSKGFLGDVAALVEEVPSSGPEEIPISAFSGLAAAKDQNWPDLVAYGGSLKPRSEWGPTEQNFYGFETDADFSYLRSQLDKGFLSAVHFEWTGRVYFGNTGISHRIAAYCRQNREQNRQASITLPVSRYRLNAAKSDLVFGANHCVLCSPETYDFLHSLLTELGFVLPLYNPRKHDINTLWIEKEDDDALRLLLRYLSNLDGDRCFVFTPPRGAELKGEA